MNKQQSHSHWVEQLFPPTFTCSKSQLIPVKDLPSEKCEQSCKDQTRVFELAAMNKEISGVDLDRIENVYERVWLMRTLQQQNHSGERGINLLILM